MTSKNSRRVTSKVLVTVMCVAAVFSSAAGCGPGYRSSYYHRAPVVIHRHEVHHYYHNR